MDESKQTDAHDISNCDFTELQSQETMRNLHIDQKESMDGKNGTTGNIGIYTNLTEEDTQKVYDLKRLQQNHSAQQIYTEEEKTGDDMHNIKIYNDVSIATSLIHPYFLIRIN